MLVDFPDNPIGGQTFASDDATWTWDGGKWIGALATGLDSFNGRTGAVVLTTGDITGAGGALAASRPPASTVPPLVDGTAAVGTSLAYARGDHVHPVTVGSASVWTQIATHNVTAGPAVVFTGLSQAYGDLLIQGAGLTIPASQAIFMQVSVNNGATFSTTGTTTYFYVSPIITSATQINFCAVFCGYTANAGLISSVSLAGVPPASPAGVLPNDLSHGISAHTGGCNALRFSPGSGSFSAAGAITIYGR